MENSRDFQDYLADKPNLQNSCSQDETFQNNLIWGGHIPITQKIGPIDINIKQWVTTIYTFNTNVKDSQTSPMIHLNKSL